MNSAVDPREIVRRRVQLQEALQSYMNRDTWTVVEGAMLLSGLCPPDNALELPPPGAKLKPIGSGIRRGGSPMYEVKNTLRVWENWCETYDSARADGEAYLFVDDAPFEIPEGEQPEIPDRFKPERFIHWFLGNKVHLSRVAVCEYRWVEPFAELVGWSSATERVSYAVANYADRIATALEVVLGKLDDDAAASLRAAVAGPPVSRRAARPPSCIPAPTGQSDHPLYVRVRGYLTTDEFAAMLGVEPQTVLKNHSKNGHYGGVRPGKLPSRRLSWPLDAVERIMKNDADTSNKC